MPQRLRVFVSSPTDVPDERLRADLIVDKLSQEYSRFFTIESYRWEHEAMLASKHFQDAIEPPSAFDIVVLILWSRLGTPLPVTGTEREYRGIDGRTPVTGTEWEYEEALRVAREKGAPDLLAFRNISPALIDPRDPDAQGKSIAQLGALNAFWTRHFADRGVFLAAYDEYRTLEEFAQRLEESLRKLIERRIKDNAAGVSGTEPIWLGEPFRGLESYEFEHALIFFGRDAPVMMATKQLAANARSGCAFLLVCGPSGSGKSSMVKAGIVPRLMKPQRISGIAFLRRAVFRPGAEATDVIVGLAKALTRAGGPDVGMPELIAPGQDAGQLATHLRGAVGEPGYLFTNALGRLTEAARESGRLLAFEDAKLILVVDQLEELFTGPGIGPEEQRLFIQLLAGLARSGAVWVIATLRADFWHRAISELITLAGAQGRIDLAAPSPAELAEMIRKPAQAAGLSFEAHRESGLDLDVVLAEDAAAEPGALPLLSFTLDKLYKEAKERGETVLTHASYEALGGLKGAIASRADSVLAGLAEPAQSALPRVLRALVTVGPDAHAIVTARPAALDRFPEGNPERRLIDAFLAARLLVSEQGEGPASGARIRVAHEALLSHWGRARDWINVHRADLQLQQRIESDAARWAKAPVLDKAGLLLPPGLRLNEAQDLVSRCRDDLSDQVRGFVAESAAAEAERRKAEQDYYRQLLRPTAFGLIINLVPVGAASLIFLLFSGQLVGGIDEIYVSYLETLRPIQIGLAAITLIVLSAVLYESHRILSALGIDLIYSRRSTPDISSAVRGVQRATGFVLAISPWLGLAVGFLGARNFVAHRYCQLLDLPGLPPNVLHDMQHLLAPNVWLIAGSIFCLGAATALFLRIDQQNKTAPLAVALIAPVLAVFVFLLFTDRLFPSVLSSSSIAICLAVAAFAATYFLTYQRLEQSRYAFVFYPRLFHRSDSYLGMSWGERNHRLLIAWAFLPWFLLVVYFAIVPHFASSMQAAAAGADCPVSHAPVPVLGQWTIFPVVMIWAIALGLSASALLDKFRGTMALRCAIAASIALLVVVAGIIAPLNPQYFVAIYRSVGALGAIAIDLVFLIAALTLLTVVSQKSEFPMRIFILFAVITALLASISAGVIVAAVIIVAVYLLVSRVAQLPRPFSIAVVVLVLLGLESINLHEVKFTVAHNPPVDGPIDPLRVSCQFESWLEQRGIAISAPSSPNRRNVTCPSNAQPPVNPASGGAPIKKYAAFIIAVQGGGIDAASAASLFLARLQALAPHFAEHVFAISGVSGGAIGATVFQTLARSARENCAGAARLPTVPSDSCGGYPAHLPFARKVQNIMQDDHFSPIIGAILPEFLGFAMGRAQALTASFDYSVTSWDAAAGQALRAPFASHWTAAGTAPALVLNSTWVETGFRVAFAPFHLHDTVASPYSFSDPLMPDEDCPSVPYKQGCVSLIEAAVVSARMPPMFPPFSVSIRGLESRKWNFVDGGYADNSGAATALDIYKALQSVAPQNVDLRIILITSSNPEPDPLSNEVMGTYLDPFGGTNALVKSSGNAAVAAACREIYPDGAETCIGHSGQATAPLQIVEMPNQANAISLGWVVSRTSYDVLSWALGQPASCLDDRQPSVDQASDQSANLKLTNVIMQRNSCVMKLIVDLSQG